MRAMAFAGSVVSAARMALTYEDMLKTLVLYGVPPHPHSLLHCPCAFSQKVVFLLL